MTEKICTGLNIRLLGSTEELAKYLNFASDFKLIDMDYNKPSPINKHNRLRLDAEVLSLIAANLNGNKMLEIGTHKGMGTSKIALNAPNSEIFTVNIHPQQAEDAGVMVTDILPVEEIGSFYRQHDFSNIKQIYANTKYWLVPDGLKNLSLVYIDGCHDTDFVYSDTKLIFDHVKPGGFILWHDFSPLYRAEFNWIDAAMQGVERAVRDEIVQGEILHVKHSWIGIWHKPSTLRSK